MSDKTNAELIALLADDVKDDPEGQAAVELLRRHEAALAEHREMLVALSSAPAKPAPSEPQEAPKCPAHAKRGDAWKKEGGQPCYECNRLWHCWNKATTVATLAERERIAREFEKEPANLAIGGLYLAKRIREMP